VFLKLRQSGKSIRGEGFYEARVSDPRALQPKGSKLVTRKGDVFGIVDGSNITLDMEWDDRSGGYYTGVIGPTGIIRGTVHVDQENPTNNWRWISKVRMKCVDYPGKYPTPTPFAAPAQPSPKRLISHKGEGPTDAAAPAGVPRIAAFNKPGQASTQVLTWDAGRDHPYAQVWVKVDGADETKVVEQGKGTREMTVEAGKTYQYILTDSRQQLATTTVKAK
jgi:hypothetical protein